MVIKVSKSGPLGEARAQKSARAEGFDGKSFGAA